jgi:invasion protein IalB
MTSIVLSRAGAGILAALVFAVAGSPVLAQTLKSPDPAPVAKSERQRLVDAEPTSTSASFGDWALRCQRLGDGAKLRRVCEVAQQIHAQGQQSPVAEIAIGRLEKADPLRLTLALPVNVDITNQPIFSADGKEPDHLDLGWRKCVPGGCFADAPLKDEVLRRWTTQSSDGRLAWRDATGRDLAIELSFRGLTQALDAMSKEP